MADIIEARGKNPAKDSTATASEMPSYFKYVLMVGIPLIAAWRLSGYLVTRGQNLLQATTVDGNGENQQGPVF